MHPLQPPAPNGLLLFVVCVLAAFGLMGLLKLNHWWVMRGRPKSEPPEAAARPARPSPFHHRSPVISRPYPPPEPRLTDLLLARLLGTERANATPPVQERSPQQDARSDVQDRSAFSGVQGEMLPNSREELQSLIAAIRHKEDGKTKQEAIERAFGIKKGGSEKWKRASELFDQATQPPSRYQAYDEAALRVLRRAPEDDAARIDLGLEG